MLLLPFQLRPVSLLTRSANISAFHAFLGMKRQAPGSMEGKSSNKGILIFCFAYPDDLTSVLTSDLMRIYEANWDQRYAYLAFQLRQPKFREDSIGFRSDRRSRD